MGFAQKVWIKKKNSDGVGRTCGGFLSDIDIFKFVVGGMMCDAATETLEIIRYMDREDVDTTTLNSMVDHFLDHIVWLYFEAGVLQIQGHTAFIIEWIESKPHHYICQGESKCFGGSKIPASIIRKALHHMQAWAKLTKYTCEAEFPSFALLSCLNAFELPRQAPKKGVQICPPEVERKVMRLGVIFGKPKVLVQFKAMWHHGFVAYKASNFTLGCFDAWLRGMETHGAKETDHLEYVCLRGKAFKAATSKVEQSFSKVDQMLNKNRLNASAGVENMYVNLFMADDMNDVELDSVIDGAITVWKTCFASKQCRSHTVVRNDKDVPHNNYHRVQTSSLPTEKDFLKGIRDSVKKNARPGSSDALLAGVPLWEKSHEDEMAFQQHKRRKKEVEACLQDHLLHDERDAVLLSDSAAERIRQAKSYAGRLQDRLKYKMKTTAVDPTPSELFRSKVYLDVGTNLPREWLATLARVEATVTNTSHAATLFVADNPRSPTSPITTLVASLVGSWVVSPSVFVEGRGPSVKYLAAITSKRLVWASPAFKQTYQMEWLSILEVANSHSNSKWRFLVSSQEWAKARAIAESKKRPADVIALVGPLEMRDSLKHCFSPAGLVAFIARSDPNKGSIGLLNM